MTGHPGTANGAAARIKPPASAAGARAAGAAQKALIQRKLGLEFEIQVPPSHYIQGEETVGPDKAAGFNQIAKELRTQLFADVTKKIDGRDRVYGHDIILDNWNSEGWKVTADNTSKLGTHRANLEIVTRAIDTETFSPGQCELQLQNQINKIEAWLATIRSGNPQDNRVRVAGRPYTIGFPSDAMLKWLGVGAVYQKGPVSYDAYVQVNIGVPFAKVAELTTAAEQAGTKVNNEEGSAHGRAAKLLKQLLAQKKIEPADAPAVEGFLRLLFTAVLGAQASHGTLLKNLWSILPKSGLDGWWQAQIPTLSEKGRSFFAKNNVKAVVGFCWQGLAPIVIDEPLLKRYTVGDFKHIGLEAPIFLEAQGYTVRRYLEDVLGGTKDLLADISLQHRSSTGAGTSRLAVDRPGTAALGVMEVRNVGAAWPLNTWFTNARPWLIRAYNMTRNWDVDTQREKEYHDAVMEEYSAMARAEQTYDDAWRAAYS